MKPRFVAIAGLLLVLVVGSIGAYTYWIRTPQYSLQRIGHAIKTHDLALFEKHVDVESVSTRLIDDILAGAVADSPITGLGSALALGMIQIMKPRLVETVREQVARLVETGSFTNDASGQAPTDSEAVTLEGLSRGLGAEQDGFEGTKYVRRQGKIALVGLGFRNGQLDTTLTLELKFRNEGSYWKLIEFSNMRRLMERTRDLQASRLAERNEPIRRELDRILTVTGSSKRSRSDSWGISKYVDLRLTVRNISTKSVSEFEATLLVLNPAGTVVRKARVRGDSPIAPANERKSHWALDVNMFDGSDQALYDLPSREARIEATFDRILFVDGSEIKVYGSLEEAQGAQAMQAAGAE